MMFRKFTTTGMNKCLTAKRNKANKQMEEDR